MIHPSAIIDPSAKIGKNVEIGPWTWIGADVVIGDGCVIGSHVVIKGPTVIGEHNRIFQFASIGEDCQDKKYAGEPTRLVIGNNNVFRESVTIHRGTVQDNSLTQIGDDNLFMAYVHVAHDCMVGNDNILANNATLAGHVHVGDHAILGGFTGIHQFCKVGSYSFCGVGSVVVKDVLPYLMVAGQNAVPHGMNFEGLKRRGFSKSAILELRRAYKTIYRNGLTLADATAQLEQVAENEPAVKLLVDFIKASERGIIR
ncbi:acyl-ACP--UDP-N-acetylglucosamine O-acyltransferase [Catenovulum adriaticum]|uniref:Acyl-[acyl-carrier-protein]--UDP-N-acetylglucosamine O-acyltransferase n=1 Tax=Catenovulum adriaticum TaxID=2984846 RepID=A0ABY7AUA1_9ALTE|nr:acyl-ACP--UDP-N-acetylglucosamine O-acyltransferase [Catenovulum sp. TS8]WAJ72357.1 acyl-ACP--UDP-N-acetylglucosamine O-acyltransferase [Catenovulum sp. TS8]